MMIASSEFTGAANAQADALAFEPAGVYVSHPIQDRTDDEMRGIADAAVDEIVAALTGG